MERLGNMNDSQHITEIAGSTEALTSALTHDRHLNGIDMSQQEAGLSGTFSASNRTNTRKSSFLRRGNFRRHRKLVDILSTKPSLAVRLSCHGARSSSQAPPPRPVASLNMMGLLHTILSGVQANTTAIGQLSLRVESLEKRITAAEIIIDSPIRASPQPTPAHDASISSSSDGDDDDDDDELDKD